MILFYAIRQQQGFTEMLPLAFLLPVAILLIAGGVDFSRVPIMQERLLTVLEDAAYRSERALLQTGSTDLLDPIAPAGNVLCSYVASRADGSCVVADDLTGQQGFMTRDIAALLVNQSCTLMSGLDEQVSGFLGTWGSDPHYAAQFAIVRIDYDPQTGAFASSSTIAKSDDTCTPNGLKFSQYSQDVGVTTTELETRIADVFAAKGGGAGAWYIENDSVLQGYSTTMKPYLSSYWMLGIAYLHVQHLFPKIFGEYVMVGEYFIRPLNNPAGIQQGGV